MGPETFELRTVGEGVQEGVTQAVNDHKSSEKKSAKKKIRVLVIEDEADIRRILKDLLESLDCVR